MPAAVALAIFVPWMVRDWLVFGNPLPGQALSNALSVTGFDIFAWNDPPTLARYLAEGPQRLLLMRAEGIYHNLFTVLLLPGIPAAFLGLIALPWFIRLRAILPLAVLSITTFLVTSLLFPVSTTWGTYLHAAGAAHVLLIVCALLALDAAIERVGQIRGWTRPVAWLGGALTIFGSLLFMAALMPTFGGLSVGLAQRYEALAEQMEAAGLPLEDQGPIITNFPIWLSESTGARALALPAESPADVLDLANTLPGDAAAHPPRRRARRLAGGSRHQRSRAPIASTRSTSGPRPIRGSLARSRTLVCTGWSVHEWRPLYSEADGRSTHGCRAPAARTRPRRTIHARLETRATCARSASRSTGSTQMRLPPSIRAPTPSGASVSGTAPRTTTS